MDSSTIRKFKPGRVLDGHVHDVLGLPEPIWPHSTHPAALPTLRAWLKEKSVTLLLPGEAHAGDDCVLHVPKRARESFDAVSESHALCLAVLLADCSIKYGQEPKPFAFYGAYSDYI
jgi:hypothetical protein